MFRAGVSKAVAGAALAGATAGLFYAYKVESLDVEVSSVALLLPLLSREFDGYRIAQISDIHMDGWMTFDRLSKLAKL
ncbi:MAG: metallophosphoesterase, partial [Rubrobacter sp.]|nr:metallophosphoesterase [Rubrobacter sp.]